MCSAHQTPAQLYRPAWGHRHMMCWGQNLDNLQMLWHVPGLGSSQRQWGCAHSVPVKLQEEWAVEREDTWLVDAGSRYTVSILLYNCADPEPDLRCRTHTCEFISNGSKTLPLPTSADKSYSHQIHTTLLNQRYVPYQYIVQLADSIVVSYGPLEHSVRKLYPTMKCVPHYIPPPYHISSNSVTVHRMLILMVICPDD